MTVGEWPPGLPPKPAKSEKDPGPAGDASNALWPSALPSRRNSYSQWATEGPKEGGHPNQSV